jgi:CDP-diacylglycerol--glycerol-3-phosphate 3-phosphatidyltransferase
MSTTAEKRSEAGLFNVPNQITAARLVLAIVVFVLIPLQQYFAALVVFVIAASTDWVDGYWARRFHQVTKVGRILDPFVDKFIICGIFIFLAAERESRIEPWMAVVVVTRELLVTALRSAIEQSGGDFSASMPGKLKMVFQCIAAGASLLVLAYTQRSVPSWLPPTEPAWLVMCLVVFVWLAILSTVYSGLDYLFAATRLMRNKYGSREK